MRLARLLDLVRTIAPESGAESWDRVGLQVGDPSRPVRRATLCIDLTEPVLQEAINQKSDLIVAYHPPVFEPLQCLNADDWKQGVILEAARRRIAIYTPHTALDAAPGGVNDWLAETFSGRASVIRPSPQDVSGRVKLVTFIPPQHTDALRAALSTAGAGRIGDYFECSFSTFGHGTFCGGASTKPAIGKSGRLERVEECRMEMVCPASELDQVISVLRHVHPYEEPAIDVVPLCTVPGSVPAVAGQARGQGRSQGRGQGRVVHLDRPLTLSAAVARIRKRLAVRQLRVASPRRVRPLRRIALCPGAGGSLLAEAGQVDAFLTGEMRHHDVLDAVQRGIAVILPGHTETERPYLTVYRRRLVKACGPGVTWRISRADRSVLKAQSSRT